MEVIDGSITVRVGRSERALSVGDSADVPRRKLHVVRNVGDGEARFLLEVRPARRMEAAMRALFPSAYPPDSSGPIPAFAWLTQTSRSRAVPRNRPHPEGADLAWVAQWAGQASPG